MKKITFLFASIMMLFNLGFAQDLIITGAFDGPLSGGTPKGVELYVVNDIADLSIYGIGSANNGGGTDGEEFTFPADSYTAGDFIYVTSEAVQFTAFFGFAPTYNAGSAMGINGDDAVELFKNSAVTDVFGDINQDGTGQAWDHLDGWAYRVNNTGPDGSSFILANWTFSGTNQLEGGVTNGTCTSPFPIGTFTFGAPTAVAAPSFDPGAGSYFSAQNVTISTTTAGANIYYTTDGTDPDNTSTLYVGAVNIAATTTLKAIGIDPGAVLTDSPISTGVYTIETTVPVADIATLRAQADDNSTYYELTGEALLSYQQSFRSKKYIQDATAGVEIDDPSGNITTTYNIGDGITGIVGKLNTFNGMLQFVPQTDPGAASSTGNTITPMLISATEFNTNFDMYESMLVQIDNLTFADAGSNFSTGQVYPTMDPMSIGVDFRTSFYDASYIGSTIPSGGQDVIGIVTESNGTPYLTSRETPDIMQHVPVIPINSMGIIIAGLLMGAVIVIRRGRLF